MQISEIEELRGSVRKLELRNMMGTRHTFGDTSYILQAVVFQIENFTYYTTGFLTKDSVLVLDPNIVKIPKRKESDSCLTHVDV